MRMTFVCGRSCLIRLVNSNPLMLGIIKSAITTSGRSRSTCARALPAVFSLANSLGTAYWYDLPTREEWNA